MSLCHKNILVDWTKVHVYFIPQLQENIVFSDETRFNLDGLTDFLGIERRMVRTEDNLHSPLR